MMKTVELTLKSYKKKNIMGMHAKVNNLEDCVLTRVLVVQNI